MGEIRWRHGGQRLLLPVAILPTAVSENSQAIQVIECLIDTGATGTGLRPDVAQALQILGRGKRRVLTANGDMLVPEFRIRLGFYCGEFDGEAQAGGSPYVLEFGLLAHALRPQFPYAALIGMDVLSRCELHLKPDSSVTLKLPTP